MVISNLSVRGRLLNIKTPAFSEGKHLTSGQKARIFRSFVLFVESGFNEKHFSKAMYSHLSLNCGFSAHFNCANFFLVRFHSPQGRVKTLAQLSSRGGSQWRFVDENSSGTADLSRAIADFVDAVAVSTLEGARNDELANINQQILELTARRDALNSSTRLDDARIVDMTI